MVSYQKQGVNLSTRYTLEYISNKNDLDYVESGRIDDGEPGDRYKRQVFNDLERAMTFYCRYIVDDGVFDIRLFEEIVLDGETVREATISPDLMLQSIMRKVISKSLYEEAAKNARAAENMEQELETYRSFIRHYGITETVNEFVTGGNNNG